jgi:hypothetical protein
MHALVTIAVALAVVWVPGAIVTRLLREAPTDPLARVGEEVALGLAFWPVLFLFTSILFAWSTAAARVLFVAMAVAVIARARLRMTGRTETLAALVLLAVVAWTRVSQVEGITFPLWVDSVHHTMIVRLLVDGGRLPSSYAPFIEGSTFYYHWGFHAVAAFVAWVTGETSPAALPRLLLHFGQILNALTFFSVWSGASALLGSRRAALLAATLATLVSFFPAYYVSWGRYTQLCGLLLLPALAAATWRLGRHPTLRRVVPVALLLAGLLLIHARVAAVFAILALILSGLLVFQCRWRGLGFCAVAAGCGVLLAAPWLVHLARTPEVRTILAPSATQRARWESPNELPGDLLWAPNQVSLYLLATGGLLALTPVPLTATARLLGILWWLALVAVLWKRQQQRRRSRRFQGARLAVLSGWVLLVALAVNLDRFGLPRFRLLTNGAAIIMLFLPLSLAGAQLIRWVFDGRRLLPVLTALVIGVAGASTMRHIINPRTLLVTAADGEALAWVAGHVPPSARFGVGVQPWIGGSYMGIDGGYWIPLVAGRASILPPGLYPWVLPAARVEAITRSLEHAYEAQQSGSVEALRAEGVTHLYFGARNTTRLREILQTTAAASRIYDRAGVEIYAMPGR